MGTPILFSKSGIDSQNKTRYVDVACLTLTINTNEINIIVFNNLLILKDNNEDYSIL